MSDDILEQALHEYQEGGQPVFDFLDRLRDANLARVTEKAGGIDHWHPWEWTNALAGEVGEACNLTKKMRRMYPAGAYMEFWNKPEERRIEDLEAKLAKEIADIVIYADLLAARIGKNLAEIVREKFNEKSREIESTVFL